MDLCPLARQISLMRRPEGMMREGNTFFSRSSCTGITRFISKSTAYMISSVVSTRLVVLPKASPTGMYIFSGPMPSMFS